MYTIDLHFRQYSIQFIGLRARDSSRARAQLPADAYIIRCFHFFNRDHRCQRRCNSLAPIVTGICPNGTEWWVEAVMSCFHVFGRWKK